ncbi:hypothetical protein VNO80_10364 [Phaseolus coccineus]|uniref:Uncharacterized protein n=1 Tax=Phaseolus coccineus TaxID=3886 RepID=A0AAN9N7Z8_PHACN
MPVVGDQQPSARLQIHPITATYFLQICSNTRGSNGDLVFIIAYVPVQTRGCYGDPTSPTSLGMHRTFSFINNQQKRSSLDLCTSTNHKKARFDRTLLLDTDTRSLMPYSPTYKLPRSSTYFFFSIATLHYPCKISESY